jgi:hypothetical protein
MRQFAAAALLAALALPAAAQDKAQLGTVTLHLFLEPRGVWSPDVATMPEFQSFNFGASGKGMPEDAKWDALLIRVQLRAPKEIFAKGQQAVVTVTHRKTKKVIRRAVIADVYIGTNGTTWKPVLVDNVGCAPMDIVVQSGAQRFVKSLEINCGE